MAHPSHLYHTHFGLLTDLYQLTMAYGYWQSGLADREAVFHLSFRQNPFEGEFAVACGLDTALDILQEYSFESNDLDYLANLSTDSGDPLFPAEFLNHLASLKFSCSVAAIPEGTVVFPHEPLLRVRGPLLQCQLLETLLLTIINFQTLIATKAARICRAAEGDAVMEFGLRRAQGIDGGVSASRAAMIGGCRATSNVLAGQLFDVPVRGTHAHSWVMAFENELQAFQSYADAMPHNSLLLVDTYDTLNGVRNAVKVGKKLREKGYHLAGIRLDSGNLLELSLAARRILNEHGFPQAIIVASNDLDEYEIDRLKRAGAAIDTWGVGTRLITAYDQPALSGVFKLAAIRTESDDWRYCIKRTEEIIKSSTPGCLQVRRYLNQEQFVADTIFDKWNAGPSPTTTLDMDTGEPTMFRADDYVDLLQPVFQMGQRIVDSPSVLDIQKRVREQLKMLPDEVQALRNAKRHTIGIEKSLYDQKTRMMLTDS